MCYDAGSGLIIHKSICKISLEILVVFDNIFGWKFWRENLNLFVNWFLEDAILASSNPTNMQQLHEKIKNGFYMFKEEWENRETLKMCFPVMNFSNLLRAWMDFWPKLLQFVGGCITLPDQWIYCLTGLFSAPCHWKCRHWSLAKRAIHHCAARILGARLCIAGFVQKSLFTNER